MYPLKNLKIIYENYIPFVTYLNNYLWALRPSFVISHLSLFIYWHNKQIV